MNKPGPPSRITRWSHGSLLRLLDQPSFFFTLQRKEPLASSLPQILNQLQTSEKLSRTYMMLQTFHIEVNRVSQTRKIIVITSTCAPVRHTQSPQALLTCLPELNLPSPFSLTAPRQEPRSRLRVLPSRRGLLPTGHSNPFLFREITNQTPFLLVFPKTARQEPLTSSPDTKHQAPSRIQKRTTTESTTSDIFSLLDQAPFLQIPVSSYLNSSGTTRPKSGTSCC